MHLRHSSVLRWSHLRLKSTLTTAYLPTIYALSTPPGTKSAIAVVRISGAHSKYIYHQITRSRLDPIPRKALLRSLYEPGKNNLLDKALTLFFDSPKTFTGEDLLELHLHGGKAVVNSVLRSIGSLNDRKRGIDIRYALPGEFSQRAFQNGKFDLTEIEGIRVLIDAETETQRRCALSSFNGENKERFALWRQQIVDSIAQLTAIIDFGEDTEIDDIENIFQGTKSDMVQLQREIRQFIKKIDKSSILQSGIRVVLIGPPNAGKSSLVNSISNEDISIISRKPGTTRDAVEVSIDVNGYKVSICDTAGIRSRSTDDIELLGIEKARKKSKQCDLCLLIVDPQNKPFINEDLKQVINTPEFEDKEIVIIVNKKDLLKNDLELKLVLDQVERELRRKHPVLAVSCLTQNGIEELIEKLTDIFQRLSETTDDSDPILVSQRVREILHSDVLYGIEEFFEFAGENGDVVMASESLRHAAEGIGKITGDSVGIEEVLGVVFANFCVGK
ncbi:related to tRNA modification GTPase MSS1,mitochondrial [Zygosaccharomyces bailii ISA1307]|nr:related to tRNA modification GTPase MSS1,mitochondrial [Zygosaccharomyces bailii ISA1307]